MDDLMIKRVMPHSVEAEQAVISSMLLNREAIQTAAEMLSGADFYQVAQGTLFQSMVEMDEKAQAVDPITLSAYLKTKDVPVELSELDYLYGLTNMVSTSSHIKHYASIVKEKSTKRQLIKMMDGIADTCYKEQESIEAILEQAEKSLFRLIERGNVSDFVPIRQIVLNTLANIERAAETQGSITGVPTGFVDLDLKLAGLQPSDFILIAARPSMGKTAFVLNIAQYAAFRQMKSVLIFSLEMAKEQLMNRFFALETSVDAQVLRTGNLSDDDWMRLIEGISGISNTKMDIDDTSGITLAEMRSKCRKKKMESGLDLIIIDYLQLMTGSSNRSESRQAEIAEISRGLKGLARELNVPVVALSQLSRAVEQRPNKRPMMSDLRESGAIEQDADVCMFIYRDDYYNQDSDDKGVAEIIIGKQRNGPIGTVRLSWIPKYTKFANILEQRQEY